MLARTTSPLKSSPLTTIEILKRVVTRYAKYSVSCFTRLCPHYSLPCLHDACLDLPCIVSWVTVSRSEIAFMQDMIIIAVVRGGDVTSMC